MTDSLMLRSGLVSVEWIENIRKDVVNLQEQNKRLEELAGQISHVMVRL